MGSVTGDSASRKKLLLAQIALERTTLSIELAELRHLTATPQLARGLWRAAFGARRGGPVSGMMQALLATVSSSGLFKTLLGSGVLSGLFGALFRSRPRPGVRKPPLFAAFSARYPLLASAVGILWPIVLGRRPLRRLVLLAAVTAVGWQLWRVFGESDPPAN